MTSPPPSVRPATERNQPHQPHAAGESRQMPPLGSPSPQGEHRRTAMVPEDGSRTSPPQNSRRKLDPAMKEVISRLVKGGHTLLAAASLAGVSRRTIYREKRRDPEFKLQLGSGQQQAAHLCFKTLEEAAAHNWQAAERFFKLVYPDRYYYRPGTITRKQHNAWTTEVLAIFEGICTPDQMRELHRQLSDGRKKPARAKAR